MCESIEIKDTTINMVLPDNPETDSPQHYSTDDGSYDYPNQILNNPQFIIDNDNENILNNGYQPLGSSSVFANDDDTEDDDDDSSDSEHEDGATAEQTPAAPSIDSVIQLELWNNPRPFEANIELDTKKTQEILSAMATISLPNSAVPQWAQNVPEDKWKDVLLDKIRQKK